MRGWLARRSREADTGFTLIELVVAMSITVIMLTALLGVLVGSLQSVALSKQRQTATALGTRAMEQLRALPYATVTAGIDSSTAAYTSDPRIVHSSPPTFTPPGGSSEILMAHTPSGSLPAPLSPHLTSNTLDGVSYSVGTYVSTPSTTSATFNLTVIIAWSSNVSHGIKTSVQRSTLYSASRCELSTATHTFSGPCQAAYTGQAGLTAGAIVVSNADDSTVNIPGFGGTKLELGFPSLSENVSIEQVSKVTATAGTSSATATTAGVASTSGGVTAGASSSTDPTSSSSAEQNAVTTGQTSTAQTINGSAGTITVAPSGSDSGVADAQAASGGTNCINPLSPPGPTSFANGLPCAAGQLTQSGSDMAITANLSGASSSVPLPVFDLARVSTGTPQTSRAMVARVNAADSTLCPTATSGGCISAAATRSLGNVVVGQVPAGGSGLTGYTGSFQVTGLVEKAAAASSPASAVHTYTRSGGTLTYWNGSAYQTVDLTTLAPGSTRDWTTGTATATYVSSGHSATITVSSTIHAAPASGTDVASGSGSSPCMTDGCSSKTGAGSVITATTVYLVQLDGVQFTKFAVVTDLGSLLAQTFYRGAPSAP